MLLYNCEIWTLTKEGRENLDTFTKKIATKNVEHQINRQSKDGRHKGDHIKNQSLLK